LLAHDTSAGVGTLVPAGMPQSERDLLRGESLLSYPKTPPLLVMPRSKKLPSRMSHEMGNTSTKNTLMQILIPVLAAVLMHAGSAAAQSARFESLSNLPFAENRPTAETAEILRDELLFQRATQTYLWALPLINTLGMKVGSEKVFGVGYHVLPVWKKRLDAKTLITTPNSDVIYAMGYVDLGRDGPLVFEAPPNLQGILLDAWQRPIPVDGGRFFGDVGLPGPDGGKGGQFLLLPPGYEGAVPDDCFVYRSPTNNCFVFLRAF